MISHNSNPHVYWLLSLEFLVSLPVRIYVWTVVTVMSINLPSIIKYSLIRKKQVFHKRQGFFGFDLELNYKIVLGVESLPLLVAELS